MASASSACDYASIFGEFNDWKLVEIEKLVDGDMEDDGDADADLILEHRTDALAMQIAEGMVGAITSGGDPDYSYYLVKFLGPARPSLSATVIKDFTPHVDVAEGDLIVEARFYNRVPRAHGWWTLQTGDTVTVPAHFLLYVDIEIETEHDATDEGPALSLPRGCNQREARAASCVHVPEEAHEAISSVVADRDLELDRVQ